MRPRPEFDAEQHQHLAANASAITRGGIDLSRASPMGSGVFASDLTAGVSYEMAIARVP